MLDGAAVPGIDQMDVAVGDTNQVGIGKLEVAALLRALARACRPHQARRVLQCRIGGLCEFVRLDRELRFGWFTFFPMQLILKLEQRPPPLATVGRCDQRQRIAVGVKVVDHRQQRTIGQCDT